MSLLPLPLFFLTAFTCAHDTVTPRPPTFARSLLHFHPGSLPDKAQEDWTTTQSLENHARCTPRASWWARSWCSGWQTAPFHICLAFCLLISTMTPFGRRPGRSEAGRTPIGFSGPALLSFAPDSAAKPPGLRPKHIKRGQMRRTETNSYQPSTACSASFPKDTSQAPSSPESQVPRSLH